MTRISASACLGFLAVVLGSSSAWAASANSAVVMYKCVDGIPGSASIVGVGRTDPKVVECDADGVADGVCRFTGSCPLCSFSTPRCLAPCYVEPIYDWAAVPAGRARAVRIGRQQVLFRCALNHAPRPR